MGWVLGGETKRAGDLGRHFTAGRDVFPVKNNRNEMYLLQLPKNVLRQTKSTVDKNKNKKQHVLACRVHAMNTFRRDNNSTYTHVVS